MGYDIADYCAIDPLFGTMDDMLELIDALHRRGMKILLDGVFNHTSDQHPWFQDSLNEDNGKSDWYIWSTEPNNWQSAFGGSAWTYSSKRQAYYLHTFASSQPDLNWSNPEVQNAILEIQQFWYERGVDGFRLDVFNAYCKDVDFRDNPRRRDVIGLIGGVFYGYIRHEHLYDRDRPELLAVLKSFRRLADQYDALLVGETLDERFEYARAKTYVGSDGLHVAFDFSPLHSSWSKLQVRIQQVSESVQWPAWVWSNHDFPRQSARWPNHPNRSRLMMLIQMMLPGVPVVYYGEEIDMPEGTLRRREIVDPVGRRFYPFYKGRDGARLPMCWGDSPFSASQKTWLPQQSTTTVQSQKMNPDSPLHWMKQLITLRQSNPDWFKGVLEWVADGFVFRQSDFSVRVVLNWSRSTIRVPVACRDGQLVLKMNGVDVNTLGEYEGGVWIVDSEQA
jgi:alpha-glucosidase